MLPAKCCQQARSHPTSCPSSLPLSLSLFRSPLRLSHWIFKYLNAKYTLQVVERVASLSTAAIIISTPSTASLSSSPSLSSSLLSSSSSLSSLSSKETACRMPFYYKRKGKQQNGANIVSSLGAAGEETVPSSQPQRQLVDTACSQAKASPSSPPASHLIIVILLVMLCGSCQAAWLASCQQFSCCLFAFTHGAEAGRGKQRSRARLCVCCWSGARGVCVLFSLSAAAAASVRGLTAPTVALRLPPSRQRLMLPD